MTFCWFEPFFIWNNRLSIFISRALLLCLKYYSSIRRSKIIDPIETNHRSDRDIGHFGPFAFLRDKNLRQIWYFKFYLTYFLFQLLQNLKFVLQFPKLMGLIPFFITLFVLECFIYDISPIQTLIFFNSVNVVFAKTSYLGIDS